MQVQVNTGHNIEGREALERWALGELATALDRFSQDVTRVEVHLSDENNGKAGEDKRCVMEARLSGHDPVAVRNDAPRIDEAFRGAADKLKRALAHTLDRAHDHRQRESIRREEGPAA